MHTCEHVVNRTMVNLFGCGRAVSAHIERKKSKLDFALAECPSEEQIAEIERVVNETLRKNLPVTMEFISQEEAMGRFDMKRLPEGENIPFSYDGKFTRFTTLETKIFDMYRIEY